MDGVSANDVIVREKGKERPISKCRQAVTGRSQSISLIFKVADQQKISLEPELKAHNE